MGPRRLAYLLLWTSFYEQLAWAPILVLLAVAAGDRTAVALAASAYSLANLCGNLAFGPLSDRVQRHRVAAAGLLAMAATALLHLAAATPGLLIAVRFLHGLAAAAVAPTAMASISDAAPARQRGETMARAGLIIAVASMLAPPVTGRLVAMASLPLAVSLLAAGLGLVGIIALAWPGGNPIPLSTAGSGPESPGQAPERPEVFRVPLMAAAAVIAAALMFGQNVLFYALPMRGHELGMGPAQIGGVLSAFALGAMAAFVPPLSRLADRHGRAGPLLAGLILVSLALMALEPARTTPGMAISLVVYGLGFGLVFPAVAALSADAAGSSRRGLAYGVLTAAFSAGAITGPLLTRGLAGVAPPFLVAAAVTTLAVACTALLARSIGAGRPVGLAGRCPKPGGAGVAADCPRHDR